MKMIDNTKELQTIKENNPNIKPKTWETIKNSLTKYSNQQKTPLNQLRKEATKEYKQTHTHKQLNKRIKSFKEYLETTHKPSTANKNMQQLKYLYYEIEMPKIPYLKYNNEYKITDLLTKDQIKTVLESKEKPKVKALLMFMLTSGCAVNETAKITIKDYITATKQYHDGDEDITQILKQIETSLNTNTVVPTFNIHRDKTEYDYVTFITPETTRYINDFLLYHDTRDNITLDTPLFGYKNTGSITVTMGRVNDKFNFGKVSNGMYNKTHPHGLRKYFVTKLIKAGICKDYAHYMVGHKRDAMDTAYNMIDIEELHKQYMLFMHALYIIEEAPDIEVQNINTDTQLVKELTRKVDLLTTENKQIHTELEAVKKQNETIITMLKQIIQ